MLLNRIVISALFLSFSLCAQLVNASVSPVTPSDQLYVVTKFSGTTEHTRLLYVGEQQFAAKLPLNKGTTSIQIAAGINDDAAIFGSVGEEDKIASYQRVKLVENGHGLSFKTSHDTFIYLLVSLQIEHIAIEILPLSETPLSDDLLHSRPIYPSADEPKPQAIKSVTTGCPTWDGKPLQIDVSSAFIDGDNLVDALSGKTYVVKKGMVTVEPASSSLGLVMLEREELHSVEFTWDNATIYFVLTDRFANGKTENDLMYGRLKDGKDEIGTFHGGDFVGLTEKLDYIQALGVNAIWISPPVEQVRGWVGGDTDGSFPHYGYHGYWAQDFTRIDENYGTEAEFAEFIAQAHQRGIRVVMDVVLNHPGYRTLKDMQELQFGAIKSISRVFELPNWTDWQPESHESWHDAFLAVERDKEAWSTWWGRDWVRDNIAGYSQEVDILENEILGSLSGLPDFKTESPTFVSLPAFFKNKPTNAVDLPDATVTDYLITWITSWVEKYGIDGFRVDTAKHVDKSVWKQLKTTSQTAFNTWRSNHPEQALSNTDFWMVGEVWGHGVSRSSYFDYGFDSLLNFAFQGSDANEALTCFADSEAIFASYAEKINTDDSFNVLSYLSSHDTLLYYDAVSRTAKRHMTAAAMLTLLPGAIKIFYGDESGRQYGPTGIEIVQGTRSDMNWDELDNKRNQRLLSFWQKLGNFRSRHPAIGAGSHHLLSTAPYVFSRTIKNDNFSDAVIVVYAGKRKKSRSKQ